MTALAFLFAVFLARPCPFYIMDEVEAALDDLNLGRFLDLLRRYADRAQFIVITHQKRTMEAADWLYGVSMAGNGVSKVLSRRLPPSAPSEQAHTPLAVEQASRAAGGRAGPRAARGERGPDGRGRLARWSAPAPGPSPMPREWSELFIGAESGASAETSGEPREPRRGLFRRLRENLSKTRQALGSEIQATLSQPVDEETWERLEEALIMADVGARTTASVVERLEAEATAGDLSGGEALSRRLIELLAETARTDDWRIDISARPTVILAVGVNGTGKTTTVGKLAWHLQRELGRSVLLAAADTFRAAATEQLEGWAQQAGCEIVTGPEGSDPGAVAFDAIAQANSRGIDVVLIDTAGRLHTQDDLMAELAKVRRVIARQLEGAPHETLLTVDATTGQNGLRQARMFAEAVEVGGIVLTKLDGTARGGIALAIARELGLPVKLIGVGESLEDLRPFDPEDFARALVEQ